MPRPVTVGLDGSAESLAAARWAADEARLREAPLRLVNIWSGPRPPGPPVYPEGESERRRRWTERALTSACAELASEYPDVPVEAAQTRGRPAAALLAEADTARLLVLGSRAVGPVSGFFLGRVGMALAAGARVPVVLVRAYPRESAQGGDVVVGLSLRRPCESVVRFAFDAAARRKAWLRAVHVGRVPVVWGYAPWIADSGVRDETDGTGPALSAALAPWRDRFPQVPVVEETDADSPSRRLVALAQGAALLVVGRGAHGIGPRVGPVGQAVVHHAACPVAVVPYE